MAGPGDTARRLLARGHDAGLGAPSASAAAPVEAASFQRGRTLVDVKTLSLDELIERAPRIFVGRINTVEEQDVPLRDGEGLRRTTLAAEGFTTSELMSEAKELKLSSAPCCA